MPARVFHFNDLTDKQLLERIRDNDRQAFDVFYNKYWEPLFNAACKRLDDKPACEEIIQDLFVHLYQVRHQLDINISISGYLHTALKNRILNHLRNQQRRRQHSILAMMNVPVSDNITQDDITHNALKTAIDRCLGEMPSKYREVYQLSRQQSFTVKEAAAQLGISENRAEKYVQKALAYLRANLGEFLSILPVIFLAQGK